MKLKLLLFGSLILTTQLFAQKWREMSEDVESNYYDVKSEGDAYYSTHTHGKGSGYKQFQRWLFYMQNHIDSLGNQLNKDDVYEKLAETNKRMSQNKRILATGANWTEMGPTYWRNSGSSSPGVGRLEAVRVDSKNQKNIYVGTPGGGAWKTIDGGANWKALTDNITPSAMFVWAIGLADGSPDSVYVGTESEILYSYNGGTTFFKATGITGTVRRIEVHPTNHKIILAATTKGIYRSTNAGVAWTLVTSGTTYDLRFKPDNPQVVYACGTEFYKSTDGGLTFTIIPVGKKENIKRLAVSAAMPNYVYVAEVAANFFGGLYRSTDGGNTFTTRVLGFQNGTWYAGFGIDGNDFNGQGAYNFCLAVSPTNAEEVHLGQILSWKSTNGGTSFVATSEWNYPNNTGYTHSDIHQLEYIGNTLYVGTDGGIYKSSNKGDDFTDISKGLGIKMYYHFGQSATDETMVGGGAQDNGCNLYKNNSWYDWVGLDGMRTVIDWSNSNVVYGMTQEGLLHKSINAGVSTTTISSPEGGHPWVSVLCQDTKEANTLYFGGNALYKSTNGGGNWTNLGAYNSKILDIEVANSDNKYVYVGSGTSLFYSSNAGVSFNTGSGISGKITQIAVSPIDPKKVYVSTSSGVFMSINGGANWTNITGVLPNVNITAICVDDKTDEGIYVAINYAVYYKNKNLDWIPFSDKLPLVDIRQLEYHKLAKKVRVGTYGRGIWESPAYNSLASLPTCQFSESTKSGCGLVKVIFNDQSTGNVTSRKWSFPGGTPATSTSATVTVTYSTKGVYSVTLEATNATGTSNLIKKDLITLGKVEAPITKDIFFCPGTKPAILNATKTFGNIYWYLAKDTLTKIASGDSYTAPISVTTKYFVNAINGIPKTSLGPVDNKIGTSFSHSGGQSLIFTAFKAFELLSVKINASGTKDRTIILKDSKGVVIDSKTVNVPNGESVVNLNWSIPAGIDMQLGVDAGADLIINSAGGVYPYTVANLVSISGNSAGAGSKAFYYYFYDWKIQEKGVCASKMVPVTATLNCVTATDNNLVNVSDIIYPNPVHNELSFKMNGTIKLAFYSEDGKLVKETILLNSERMMDVSNLANGIYTLVVENEGKKIITKLAKK